jgi:hypothetical protein
MPPLICETLGTIKKIEIDTMKYYNIRGTDDILEIGHYPQTIVKTGFPEEGIIDFKREIL